MINGQGATPVNRGGNQGWEFFSSVSTPAPEAFPLPSPLYRMPGLELSRENVPCPKGNG